MSYNTRTTPRRCVATIGLGVVLTATFALTSCANPVEKITQSIGNTAADKLVSELSGVEVEGFGSNEVPADFPSSIPLPDAGIASAIQHTDAGKTAWIMHFDSSANDSVYEAYISVLAADGFTEELNNEMAGAMRMAHYANDEYQVNVSLLGPADEEQIMQLQVHSK